MEIRPVGAELFYADGRTDKEADMTKPLVAFAIFRRHLKTLRPAHTVHLCVLGGYQNEELLFSHTLPTEWFLGAFAKFL